MSREIRVGLLVITGLVALGVMVFLVSEKQQIFSRKNGYTVDFDSVSGLDAGNPVQLNGVTVGSVREVTLPQRVDEEFLTVRISINRLYAERIREDSLARIKTFGLLGDKYIEITSGSPASPQIPDGGEISAAPATDVDKLIAAGGDAAANVVAISYSLRSILERMDEGQGILGQLTVESEQVARGKKATLDLLESLSVLAKRIERGEGTVGTLIKSDDLAESLERVAERFAAVLEQVETGDGTITALLKDPVTRERLEGTLENLDVASADLSQLAARLRSADGLLSQLLSDEELGRELMHDLRNLLQNLSLVSDKLAQGDGTLGKLIEDPAAYEALNDILVGVDQSKMLRWLVRNRQKSGIRVRYEDAQDEAGAGAESGPAANSDPISGGDETGGSKP